MKLKRLLVAAIASVLVLPAFSVSPESAWYSESTLAQNNFRSYAQNESLQLFYNEDASILAVRQKDSGYVWYSAPLDWEEDQTASGFVLNSIPSFVTLRAKDMNSTFRTANSYLNSFVRNGLSVVQISDGIRLEHEFTRDGFFVPLEIKIEGNSLVMSINVNEITEDTDTDLPLDIIDLQVNPYFGAAGKDEEGFMFVPDGSGAIIKFNNKRSSSVYQQYVYGRDNSIVPTRRRNVTQDISLPVFGMSREGGAGFIGVIESGISRGIINADVAQSTELNAVSAGFILRDFDSVSFRERTGTTRDVRIYEKVDFASSEDVYSVRFLFLDEGQNSVADMAEAYRKYMQQNGLFPTQKSDAEPTMMVDFVGSSDKKRTIAGLPLNIGIAYTKFSDVTETVQMLQDENVNVTVKMEGWIKGGVLGKYPSKPNPLKILGGNKGFNEMIEYLASKNVDFYAGADFVNLYQTDIGHIKELTANRMINRSPVKVPDYRMSTYTDEKTTDKYPFWILRAKAVEKNYNKFLSKFQKKYDIGISPDTLGNKVASDFVPGSTGREKTMEIFRNLLDQTSLNTKVSLSVPKSYALAYTSYATDLPTTSSRFDVEDEAVPFYQMVLHGYIPYSNLPGNRTTNAQNYKLKLLETGADVSYIWIVNHPDYIRDSRLQSYMNLYRDDWFQQAVEIYNEVAPINAKVKGAEIVDYEVDGDVRTTTYSNGVVVKVNYADKTYTVTEGSAE